MHVPRSLRQLALGLVVLLFAACGNRGSTDPSTDVPPTVSVSVPSTAPVTAVVTLDGSGSSAAGGRTLTYSWTLTSKPSGSAATIDGPTAVQPMLTPDIVGTYVVTLTVNDGVRSTSVSGSINAIAYTPPAIISDLVEPVSGTVQLALSSDPGTTTVTWAVDGVLFGTGVTVPWDTTSVANGSHVVVARLQFPSNYFVDLTRTFQVNQTTVSFTSQAVSESVGQYFAIVGAQSVNGILRVDATLDGVAVGSLAAPDACLDPSGAACVSTGLNGYAFGGPVGSGPHVVVVTATDGIGNSLGTQLRFTVTDVP